MKKQEFKISGYEIVEKEVAQDKANSGRVYVPVKWKGKKVAIVRWE